MIKSLIFAHAVSFTEASNLTNSGCTKDGCPFSYYSTSFKRCGEVDAASRMPADIWNDPQAVNEYVSATEELFLRGTKQQPCNHTVG